MNEKKQINEQSGKKPQHIIDMQKSIETTTDPTLKKAFIRIKHQMENKHISKEVKEFRKEVINVPKKPEQQVLAFLPHQMAKTSIFFPMSDKELKEENRKISRIEHETGWGKIVIEGIKLAIFQEDIFLALIKIAKDSIKQIENDYVLHINMKDVVNLLYGSSGYTKKSFERIEKTLQHFQLVRFELTTYNWQKKNKERSKTETVRSIGNIVQSYKYNKKSKDLVLYFNPHFFAYFLESMLTNINFTIRRQLKRDGSKALLRFLSTHNQPSKMHIITVLNAINYNIKQPTYALRRKLKQFIAELKKNGVLGKKTKIYKEDLVYFDVLPLKKTLSD